MASLLNVNRELPLAVIVSEPLAAGLQSFRQSLILADKTKSENRVHN
jgi:hypothetical protein